MTDNGYANTTYRDPLIVTSEAEAIEYAADYGDHIIAQWDDTLATVYPSGRVELIEDK